MDDNAAFYNHAINDFYEARRKAALEAVMSRLRGQSNELLSYEEVRSKMHLLEPSRRILMDIPISKIVGSVNRYTDFSRSFLPLHESDAARWARVRMGVENLSGLPPIEAYKVGDVYFVLDGHHRVSVARELGAETIQGYVIDVYTRVPLSPGDRPDDLILKAEYNDFLTRTNLLDLRPGANLMVTAPGQYQQLLEHIRVHQYFMGQKRKQEVPYPEAVADWYDTVYLPIAELIRERNLLRDFPGRTETDLYLWIMDHRAALSGREKEVGWEVRPEVAAADLAERYSPTAHRRLPRIAHRITNFLVPEPLESGPAPGVWRAEHLSPHRGDRLFDSILVAVPDKSGKWPAVQMAMEVAKREEARLTGLHVVAKPGEVESPEMQALAKSFTTRCAEAGVVGRLQVETGQAASLLCNRSSLVDLVVFRLNYPPPIRILKRLRSGTRLLIRRCSSPLLAVPDAPVNFESALLAYGPGRRADEALFVATYLAGRWNIPLVVVTSHKDGETGDRSRNNANATRPIERARQYLETHGVQATYVEETGDAARDPARAVLLNAEAHNASFIIMGTYESGVLVESIFGSTVDHVLRSTRRPVLICR